MWDHLKAIGRELGPRLRTIPRTARRLLIYTRTGRYILVPVAVLIVGRILINLSPVVLPGCNTAHPARRGTKSAAPAISVACEASKEDVHDITLDVLLFVLGLLASTAMERYGVRDLFAHARKIAHEAQRAPFFAKLSATRYEQTYGLLTGLAHGSYVVPSSEAMEEWFAVFFTESPGGYRGVDTHLPSEYLQRYSWYLTEHEESLKRRREVPKSVPVERDIRVLAVVQNQLGDDFTDNEHAYRQFIAWHKRNEVDVYWIPLRDARKLARQCHIPTTDVGVWTDYAVFFDNLDGGSVELSMRYVGGPRRDKLTYNDVLTFMDRIMKLAKPLTDIPPDLDIFGGDLAERWEAYVTPSEREKVLGPFLEKVLKGRPVVLDAAAGIGCESIYLLTRPGQPFSVYSNEVDGRFAAIAQERADAASVRLSLTKHRWESLPDSLDGNMRFNAVLVLGNSLCMVLDSDKRERCLTSFYESLRPGGIIVIDERNFSYLLDHREEILADPYSALSFVRDGDVMYHGHALRSYPAAIADSSVTWAFFANTPAVHSSSEIASRRISDADLHLYPFRHGELYALLIEAGFVDIDVYGDLSLVADGRNANATMPSPEAIGDSTFITYVARRAE